MKEKIIFLVLRFVGTAFVLGSLAFFLKYIAWDYGATKAGLTLVYEYFPLMMAIAMFAVVGVVFYRASTTMADFNFVYFFMTKDNVHEDIRKLVYFALSLTLLWSIYAKFHTGTLTTDYIVAVGLIVLGDRAMTLYATRQQQKVQPPAPPAEKEKV
jgi:hypothetical protein